MTRATIKPFVPPVQRQNEIDDLQSRIRVQAGSEEERGEERHVDERGRPAPDILARAQVNTDDSEDDGDSLQATGAVRRKPQADCHYPTSTGIIARNLRGGVTTCKLKRPSLRGSCELEPLEQLVIHPYEARIAAFLPADLALGVPIQANYVRGEVEVVREAVDITVIVAKEGAPHSVEVHRNMVRLEALDLPSMESAGHADPDVLEPFGIERRPQQHDQLRAHSIESSFRKAHRLRLE